MIGASFGLPGSWVRLGVLLGATVCVGLVADRSSPGASTEPVGSCARVTIGVDYPAEVPAADVAGLLVRFSYPPDLVRIPGSANDETVRERVRGPAGSAGAVFGVADNDRVDPPNVSASLITLEAKGMGRGPFVTIEFDCVGARAPASPSDLRGPCVAEASSRAGTPVAASCEVLEVEAKI